MDFLSNIQAIEARIQEIEDRFDPPQPIQPPGSSFQHILTQFLPPATTAVANVPEAGVPKGTAAFKELIHEAGIKYGVDPDLITAVIRQESGGNPSVSSSVGAMGLMQLMPDTAKSLGVTNAFDPKQNIFGGARYLRGLMDQFNGSVPLALAAYNAGSGSVRKYGGVPPYPETQNYVKSIMSMYHSMRESNT